MFKVVIKVNTLKKTLGQRFHEKQFIIMVLQNFINRANLQTKLLVKLPFLRQILVDSLNTVFLVYL